MPVSTISKDTIPMIDVPFRITGKYKGSFEESLRREYRMAFGRGMMGGKIFYPGTARIVHMRGEFTSMKFDADGASFQIEGVYVSDVAPYGLDLGVSLAATLEEKMKFFAKSVSKYAVYRGAPKGTKVIVGTPKVNVESVPIAPIGNPSRRARPNPGSRCMTRANPDWMSTVRRGQAVKKSKKFTITGVEFVRTDTHRVYIEGSRFGDIRVIVYPSPMQMQVLSLVHDGLFESDLSDAQQKMIRAAVKKFVGEQAHRNPSKPKARTYAVARAEILRALQQDGWDVRANLKMPHATYPRGGFRLWFKTQAIYESHGSGTNTFAGALSLWIGDIRTMSIEDVLAHIERVRKSSVYPHQNPSKFTITQTGHTYTVRAAPPCAIVAVGSFPPARTAAGRERTMRERAEFLRRFGGSP